jgi:hypothetical protein
MSSTWDSPQSEEELDALMERLATGPLPVAPPGVEERYHAMVRAHFAAQKNPPRPTWRRLIRALLSP